MWVSEINMQGVHSDTLYVNGKSATRTSSLTDMGTVVFDDNRVGENSNGYIDDVKIWTRALRPSEVLEAGYAAALPAEGLLAWWPFSEPTLGQSETIEPVNGYNAILHGDFTSKYDAKWSVKDECALEAHNCHVSCPVSAVSSGSDQYP